ncbi:MAG TPA: hypothetical protein VI653_28630, partial [Steroidobacteraceae bacterium]
VFSRPRDLNHMQADAAREPEAAAATVEAEAAPQRTELSTQERLVELLQAFLYAAQIDSNVRVQVPALTVVLSCYDETVTAVEGKWQDPGTVLRERLPLLSQFIESTWEAQKLEVVGLSALGKSLSEDYGDDEFVDQGPENQGWCITSGGVHTRDLTYPVAALMERVQAS